MKPLTFTKYDLALLREFRIAEPEETTADEQYASAISGLLAGGDVLVPLDSHARIVL